MDIPNFSQMCIHIGPTYDFFQTAFGFFLTVVLILGVILGGMFGYEKADEEGMSTEGSIAAVFIGAVLGLLAPLLIVAVVLWIPYAIIKGLKEIFFEREEIVPKAKIHD